MTSKRNEGVTRREFIKKTGVVGAAIGASAISPALTKSVFAANRDHILIGHPSSLTGPLAGLGEPTSWVTDRIVNEINKDGGIYIKEAGKKLPIKVKIVDVESNPNKASEMASRLIMRDKIDLMLVMYTPDVVNPVSAVCERFEMPCVCLGVPVEAWLTGGPYRWNFMSFFTIDGWTDLYIDTWDKYAAETNKVVGGLFPNDPDGTTMAPIFNKKLSARGYQFVDPGRFPYFSKDFSSTINQFKSEKVDIITGALILPDWATVWRQCHQTGFVPKIATIGKALLFPTGLETLGGDIGHGLTCEVWWSRYHPFKSSITGETPAQLCDTWEAEIKRQWGPPIGFKHGGYEIVIDVLRRAQSLEKRALRDAIAKTDLDTIVGHIKFKEDHTCETPIVLGQWVKGKKWPYELKLVNNYRYPNIKNTAEMIFPFPG